MLTKEDEATVDTLHYEGSIIERKLTTEENFSSIMILGGCYSFVYIIFLLSFRSIRSIARQYKLARKFPKEMGLRKLALDLLEQLQYQTTLTSSTEAGISALKIVSKLSSGKSLTARPLSIPGLTAQLGKFLEAISEIYSQRVVICLDELDKIEDPEELDKLLRGIKGILGQRNTHFILTVSEDALTRFSTRRRMDRGMLESAFEDIILLKRLDLNNAACMLNPIFPCTELDKNGSKRYSSTLILWLFGGGIPREVKRNALMCLEVDINPNEVSAIKMWDYLFRLLLDSTKSWAARISRDDPVSSGFLECLEESNRLLSEKQNYGGTAQEWCRNFIAIWKSYYDKAINLKSLSSGDIDEESLELERAFGRAVIEIVIDATGIINAVDEGKSKLQNADIQHLLAIFEFIPSNLAFAGRICWDYLKSIGLVEI